MRFIEIVKDWDYPNYDTNIGKSKEILNCNAIHHVYLVKPDDKAITIEYHQKGKLLSATETFESAMHCKARYFELLKLLQNQED